MNKPLDRLVAIVHKVSIKVRKFRERIVQTKNSHIICQIGLVMLPWTISAENERSSNQTIH